MIDLFVITIEFFLNIFTTCINFIIYSLEFCGLNEKSYCCIIFFYNDYGKV